MNVPAINITDAVQNKQRNKSEFPAFTSTLITEGLEKLVKPATPNSFVVLINDIIKNKAELEKIGSDNVSISLKGDFWWEPFIKVNATAADKVETKESNAKKNLLEKTFLFFSKKRIETKPNANIHVEMPEKLVYNQGIAKDFDIMEGPTFILKEEPLTYDTFVSDLTKSVTDLENRFNVKKNS